MAKQTTNPQQVLEDIARGVIRPLYVLMGEESYYIDLISSTLIDKLLDETQKDFDLSVVYGKDVTVKDVVMLARQYPMMASKKVVCLREGQDCSDYEYLATYANQPNPNAVLIINYKHGSLDRRKKYWADIERQALVVESKKMYDNELPGWIQQFVLKRGGTIDQKSATLLADFIGNDLSRIMGEIDKLFVTMPAGQRAITPAIIERNIGISKEYNDFELLNAIVRKDILKANRIALHFSKNSRNYPLIKTLATLAYFFNNLMYYHYLTDKTQGAVASELGVPYSIAKEYDMAAGHYNGLKTMRIIRWLREYDAMAKGVGARGATDGDYLRELLFRMMH